MNEFINKRSEWVSGALTLLFLAILIGAYAWGSLTLFAALPGIMGVPSASTDGGVHFNIEGAKNLKAEMAKNISQPSDSGASAAPAR